jgi:surface protein
LIAGDPKHFITTKVTDFTGIFYNKIGENHPDIRYWDVGSATSLYYMFQNSTFNNYIGTWERKLPGEVNTNSPTLKNVTNMSWLFKGNEEFNQSIGNWNTSSVTTMYLMFAEASKFNQPIGNWNTSNVTTMKSMFRGASKFNQNINTKLVTQHGVEYTAWDTKLVTTMDSMFERAKKFNYAIQKWNTSNVITMKNMFKAASMFNKSLSTNYKTDNYEFPNNKTIKFKLRLEDTYNHPDDWQNNKWKNMTNDPTVSRYALIDKGVTIKDQDGNILTMREVEYFQNDTGNKDVEIDNIKIIFDDQKYDLEVENINTFREFTVDFTLGTNTKYYITSGDEMYDEMKISLTSLDEDYPIAISYNGVDAENKNNDLLLDDDIIKKRMNAKNDTWNTVNVRTMEQMFLQAESFNGNISNWDTSSVKTMHRMFSGFDSMNIDKIFYNEFAVTEGFNSRVQNNNYMVLSSTFYIGGRDNPGENSFALASSRFSTWESDKQQFPITFKEGGKITFSAKAPNDVIVYFGFNEDKTGKFPTTTYETNKVTITPTVNKYEITIPPHTTEYYNVFLHLGTYDIMATITDVIIEYDNKKEKDYTRPMSFDKNIGAWDVRNVTNFKQMFKNNKAFDNSESDLIDGWKTAND